MSTHMKMFAEFINEWGLKWSLHYSNRTDFLRDFCIGIPQVQLQEHVALVKKISNHSVKFIKSDHHSLRENVGNNPSNANSFQMHEIKLILNIYFKYDRLMFTLL